MEQSANAQAAAEKKKLFARICLLLSLTILLTLPVILALRGSMNLKGRMELVSHRLEEYPRLYENYRKETDEWQAWWRAREDQKQAELAAYLFTKDETAAEEAEKLSGIAETLGLEDVRIVSAEEAESRPAAELGPDTASCALPDGRTLVVGLRRNGIGPGDADSDTFLNQMQAGLPGHILVLHGDSLSICPEDERSDRILESVSSLLSSGKIDPAAMTEEARREKKTVCRAVRESNIRFLPTGQLILQCAAFESREDLVIHAAAEADMMRVGQARGFGLWFLSDSVFLFLSVALWHTKLCAKDAGRREAVRLARQKGYPALFLANGILFVCVLVIHLLTSTSQSADSAASEVSFLRSVLEMEASRAEGITSEFDALYGRRADLAAAILSRNPDLTDMDSLRDLNEALGSSVLRVYDASGNLIASDEIFHQRAVDATLSSGYESAANSSDGEDFRIYRAAVMDHSWRTKGFVELRVRQSMLDSLLTGTRIGAIVDDLHMIRSIHVVTVDAETGTVTACTHPKWVGYDVSTHGIPPDILYNGYEGILNFDGRQCYSIVFSFGGSLIIVGNEEASPLSFWSSVVLVSAVLMLLCTLLFIRLISLLYDRQKADALSGRENPALSRNPPLKAYAMNVTVSVAALSVILFLTTNGNPTGLTFNMTRGAWVRGVNPISVATCIMLSSVVLAAMTLLNAVMRRMARFLTPRGKTIFRLFESIFTYISVICMILYALTMFGVNTSTLVGGVGAVALIFTLAANSLITDVLAGLFIIFDGSYTVGDIVTIDGFRGVVTDISIRTTQLMDSTTHDIKIISNSTIKQFVNQSRRPSTVTIDIQTDHDVGLVRAEELLKEELAALPQKYPEIIGTPVYLGVVALPERNAINKNLSGCTVRVSFDCEEKDRDQLTMKVYREFVWLTNTLLNDESEAGIAGSRVTDPDGAGRNGKGSDGMRAETTVRREIRESLYNVRQRIDNVIGGD